MIIAFSSRYPLSLGSFL